MRSLEQSEDDQDDEPEETDAEKAIDQKWLWAFLVQKYSSLSYKEMGEALHLNVVTKGELARLLKNGGTLEEAEEMLKAFDVASKLWEETIHHFNNLSITQ